MNSEQKQNFLLILIGLIMIFVITLSLCGNILVDYIDQIRISSFPSPTIDYPIPEDRPYETPDPTWAAILTEYPGGE